MKKPTLPKPSTHFITIPLNSTPALKVSPFIPAPISHPIPLTNTQQIFIATLDILEKTRTQKTMLESLPTFTPYQLLVATMLSARTKDSTTIPIVKNLFKLHPTPKKISELKLSELERLIYGVGFHHTKSNHLHELSYLIHTKYKDQCPSTQDALTSLPGVGRKTANCILNYAFNTPAIAVDIHVHRITNRLGWIKTTSPEETEDALMEILPTEQWIRINKLLVVHGQTICEPRKPKCNLCPITKYCEYFQKQAKITPSK